MKDKKFKMHENLINYSIYISDNIVGIEEFLDELFEQGEYSKSKDNNIKKR